MFVFTYINSPSKCRLSGPGGVGRGLGSLGSAKNCARELVSRALPWSPLASCGRLRDHNHPPIPSAPHPPPPTPKMIEAHTTDYIFWRRLRQITNLWPRYVDSCSLWWLDMSYLKYGISLTFFRLSILCCFSNGYFLSNSGVLVKYRHL